MALEGADGDLGGALRGSGHHVDGIVHQGGFSLTEKHSRHYIPAGITKPIMSGWVRCMSRATRFPEAHPNNAAPVYSLHGEQSNRQPQSAITSIIWSEISLQGPLWVIACARCHSVTPWNG